MEEDEAFDYLNLGVGREGVSRLLKRKFRQKITVAAVALMMMSNHCTMDQTHHIIIQQLIVTPLHF